MAVYAGALRLNYTMVRQSDGQTNYGTETISFNSNSGTVCSQAYQTNTNYDYLCRFIELYNLTKDGSGMPNGLDVPIIIGLEGCWAGGVMLPVGSTTASGNRVNGDAICTYAGQKCSFVTVFDSSDDDEPVELSKNGQYYKDSDGNWHNVSDKSMVATAQQVSNLPNNVEFNGWFEENEIIEGDDGNYYDLAGNELFQNLPSGVIPVHQIIPPSSDSAGNLSDGVFEATDGNYYTVNGTQVLENLPSDVTPVSQIGDIIVGSDGGYYDLHGDSTMENLPPGVTITGYDSQNDSYQGSDGKDYDIHGDEKDDFGEDTCDGVELTYTPSIRLVVDCIDIFGNQQNIGADITVGQQSLDFGSLFNFNYIRQINRVTARSLGSATQSVGNGVLRVRGSVVGAKVAVDLEGVDIDAVLGSYEVVACNFSMCDRYATPILNNDLPLGLSNHTDLDVGYFVLNQFLYFEWEGFNDVFPYCCSSYNNDEKESGSTPSPVEDKDMSKLIESIDKLTEAVHGLSTLVEVVVSPAEDVNIYNRRFHYNDENGVSGFSS